MWEKSFILLWIGQFISSLGDSFYSMALSVFVLDVTGSVAFLGVVKSVSLIPRIIIAPFAGAIVDAHDRKKIIILSDFISGLALGIVFLAVSFGYKSIWMFMIVGIILGIAGCFFDPAVNSVIPDIVSKENLVKANSYISMVYEGSNIIGSAFAGMIIKLIGAPLLFLFNGFSFIFSGTSGIFMNIPKRIKKLEKINYFKDILFGAKYVINNKGLIYLYSIVSALNFFGSIGFMLILPYFKMTNGLGIESYGIALSFSSIGLMVGFTSLSKINFTKVNKFSLFIMSGFLTSVAMIMLVNINNKFIAMGLMFLNGVGIAITNSILQVTFQRMVPADLRGKVFGFKKMLGLSLVPIALLSGGALAEIFTTSLVISISYFILFLLFSVTAFIKEIRQYINIE